MRYTLNKVGNLNMVHWQAPDSVEGHCNVPEVTQQRAQSRQEVRQAMSR